MSIRFFAYLVLCGLLRPDAYTEEEAKKTSSTGSPSLVRDQGWPKEERHSDVELDLDNTEPASFQRPTFPVESSYCLQNVSSYGSTGMEMWSLSNYESQEGGILPVLRRPLANMLRGGQLLELVSEQCAAILSTAKKWQCEETIPEAVRQRDIQRQGKGGQRKQGERQIISSSRRQSGFPFLSGGSLLTTAAIYSTLAGHGLLSIPDNSAYSRYSCEYESDQPVRPRAHPGDPKSVSRGINYAYTSQRSAGKSGGVRCKTDNQRPPCSNVCPGESKTCLSRSFGSSQATQEWMDEAPGGELCGLGEAIGHLSDKLCTTPGCRVQSPARCRQCQAQHSAAELPVWGQRSRRSSTGRRACGLDWRRGGKSKTTAPSSHAELHGIRWCRDEASRCHGDPLRHRRCIKQTSKVNRSGYDEYSHIVISGQAPPCPRKDGVNKANLVWFEDVEAYCHNDSAASMPKPKALTTAQACRHRHSVHNEPDFVSEHRAALNAFVLSWQVNVISPGRRNRPVRTYPFENHTAYTLSSCRAKYKTLVHRQQRRIHFREIVDLHIFEEDCTKLVPPLSFGTSDLNAWRNKPWKLHGPQQQVCTSTQFRTTDELQEAIDLRSTSREEATHETVTAGGPADPLLIIEDWEDLRVLLRDAPEEVPDEVAIVMYGLYQAHVGDRRSTSARDIHAIRECVLRTWDDFLLPGVTAFLHLVRPQEHLHQNEIHVIVEFSSPMVPLPNLDMPSLRRTTWHSVGVDSPIVVAAYHTPGTNQFELLRGTGLFDWCGPDSRATCNVYIEKALLLPLAVARIQQGSLIEVFVHDILDSDTMATLQVRLSTSHGVDDAGSRTGNVLGELKENSASGTSDSLRCEPIVQELKPNHGIPPDLDGIRVAGHRLFPEEAVTVTDGTCVQLADITSLMQQQRTTTVRLLGINYRFALIQVNLDEPLAQQLRDNWPLPRHQARDLLALHFVPFPPATTGSADEQLYLLELNDDRYTQVHTDDVLVLFSLSFTAPDSVKTQKICFGAQNESQGS